MHTKKKRPDHRAIVFQDVAEVPAGSVGCVHPQGLNPAHGGPEPVDAALCEDGVWRDRSGKRLTPQKSWAFTSYTGPANDDAFRLLVRDELLQAEVGFDPKQAGIVWSALSEKLASLEVEEISMKGAVATQESFLARFDEEPPGSALYAHHEARLDQFKSVLAMIQENIRSVGEMLTLFGRIAEDARPEE